jgi:hypothetical protein
MIFLYGYFSAEKEAVKIEKTTEEPLQQKTFRLRLNKV